MVWVWIALVLVLLATLVLCAVILFRKGFRVLAALGDLFAAPAILDGVHRAELEPRANAVLEAAGVARARFAQHSADRMDRKIDRQQRRMERARDLLRADAGPIAERLAGLDSTRRRVGDAYTKDD